MNSRWVSRNYEFQFSSRIVVYRLDLPCLLNVVIYVSFFFFYVHVIYES